MKMKNFVLFFALLVFSVGIVSAGFFNDIFGQINGAVVSSMEEDESSFLELGKVDKVSFAEGYLKNISCEFVREIFEEKLIDYELPKQVPFKTEIFDLYLDDEFFMSVKIKDKFVKSTSCDISEKPTYRIYVSSSLLINAIWNSEEINPVDFYNEKRKTGEIKIKPVGIFRKLKMSFINFGLKIAGLFA